MEDETTKIPDEFVNNNKKSKTKVDDEYTAELRIEVLNLAERKLINHTTAKIKKAIKLELERIMVKYNQEQAEIVNNSLSETLIHKLSDLLDFTNVCDGEDFRKDLETHVLLQEDLITIISYTIPYIPMIGLVFGGIIIENKLVCGKER